MKDDPSRLDRTPSEVSDEQQVSTRGGMPEVSDSEAVMQGEQRLRSNDLRRLYYEEDGTPTEAFWKDVEQNLLAFDNDLLVRSFPGDTGEVEIKGFQASPGAGDLFQALVEVRLKDRGRSTFTVSFDQDKTERNGFDAGQEQWDVVASSGGSEAASWYLTLRRRGTVNPEDLK